MQTKNIIIIAAIAVATATATAQESPLNSTAQPSRHEFSINAGGGLSFLHYKPAAGSAKLGLGGFAGVGYTFRFNERWGIGTGVEAALFNGKYSLASLSDNYLRNDGGEDFDYRYTLSGYRDRQPAILLNIPLMLRFQTGRFYAALGGKAGIPLSAKFNTSADKLTASAYYSSSDLTLYDPKFMGFGEFTDLSNKGNLTLKTAFFASAEAGVRWRLNDKLTLSTGLYLDYGLNNVRPSAAAPLIDYPGSDDYKLNSIVASSLTDKLNPIAAGIKIGLVFGAPSGKTAKASPEPVPSEPDPAALEAERQHKTAEEQRLAEEKLLAEQKAAEEQRLEEEKLLAEQKPVEEQRLAEERKAKETRLYAEAKEKMQQPIDGYPLNGTTLSAKQKAILDEKAEWLLQLDPDVQIIIEGHTCNLGAHPVNLSIAQKRADVVKNYLVRKGIVANRITTVSKAETEPCVPNSSEENRMKNRRVVVIVRD